MYVNALKWPVIGWVVVDLVLLVASFVSPGIVVMMTPAALAPVLLLFGLWAGYKIVEFGGNFVSVLVAGLVVGIVCAFLTVVGFGVINNVMGGVAGAAPFGVFSLALNLTGAVIGGGFALSKPASAPQM